MHLLPHAQHAAPRSPIRGPALPIGVAVTAVGMMLSIASAPLTPASEPTMPEPVAVVQVPSVRVEATEASDPCGEPSVQQALAAGDDAATIAGFGGGENFRAAVVAGNAPCISLSDPARVWVVVNKGRPLDPPDYEPSGLEPVPLQMTTLSGRVRSEVAAAVGQMADAAEAAGVGRIGANNGYRSYGLQVTTYESHVRAQGQSGADAGSARPGHSEHQTGLALDVVACGAGCGGLDGFGGTGQSDWVAAHAWEYGFIVRYEDAGTPVTGYAPEPWHLRYVGVDLAAAYHQGGFHTLEEFFGLPAAPDYAH
ncbi:MULTISPECIES: M15 family metallopeptidase [unclassified Microbacterium]|uniref:M15 family metallopeptidase n=1 Tax=unclassified Microbacterium TaxID=2609290 RepID=UPI000EA8C5E7|nr:MULTISPECIES: M15 family metallopeptidase [unclassified Microbacterium]MBT2484503.1 M15 family metallopeptidase [Microbacterium sp. ISL-108]RKN67407.1 D-alanyl-D-alanine carboxypeptidase family protein [Microbacterium sp. CGR2]